MSAGASALRLARRDARRAPMRSLLIALMIALPVAGAGFIDVMLRTVDTTGAELIPAQLGRAADVRVVPGQSGDPVVQLPDDVYGQQPSPAGDTSTQATPTVDPRGLLPAGSKVITDQTGQVQVRTADGLASTDLRELDYTDPLADGLLVQTGGRAPQTTSDVVVTQTLLDTLGFRVGDRLEMTRPERTFTIVGTVRPRDANGSRSLAVAEPGAALSALPETTSAPDLLVGTPAPFTWDQVKALNTRGVTAFSRDAVENPPPRSAIPYYDSAVSYGGSGAEIILLALVVGLVLLEVVLLAGAAFAVGTRRQSRALGLYAATGATSRQVRAVVLAQGLVLGFLGAVAGLALALAGAALAAPIVEARFDTQLPAFDLRPVELLALGFIGVVTGLLAAVLPARTAARQDVVAALSGRRGVVQTKRRYPVAGLVVAALGAGLALLGGGLSLAATRAGDQAGNSNLYALLILGGTVLTQLGLIVATPAIIGATARLGRFLPLAPRLALRDAARHRGRSAPAVAAILGAVAGGVTLTLFVASLNDHDERQYTPSLGYGQAFVSSISYPGQAPRDPRQEIEAISAVAKPDRVIPVRALSDPACESDCAYVSVATPPENLCPQDQPTLAQQQSDPRCAEAGYRGGEIQGPVVGSYDELVALTGLRSPQARDVLARGGVVVFDPTQLRKGMAALQVATYGPDGSERLGQTVEAPAVFVATKQTFLSAFLSSQAAKTVDVPVTVAGTVLAYDTPPDDNTEESVNAALARIGVDDRSFRVERGYRDNYGLGLLALLVASAVVTLGAAGIATGLAQADAKPDLATLAAIGAAPRLRRTLTAFQAAVIAGLGALLGTASGFVPMVAYLWSDVSMRVVIPWVNLLVIALVVPAVAALLAGLLTRSRLPLVRRLGT